MLLALQNLVNLRSSGATTGDFFNGPFFGKDFFGEQTPTIQPLPEQASNWQAHYWIKSRRTKEEEELLTQAERVRLGILPPELDAIAAESVKEAHMASVELAAQNVTAENAIGVLMQSRQAFEDAYVKAFKEVYTSEMIAKAWADRMKAETNRKAAMLLLLH